jgi:hypothetical protein
MRNDDRDTGLSPLVLQRQWMWHPEVAEPSGIELAYIQWKANLKWD